MQAFRPTQRADFNCLAGPPVSPRPAVHSAHPTEREQELSRPEAIRRLVEIGLKEEVIVCDCLWITIFCCGGGRIKGAR